jgi:hypothetical protein
LYFEVFDQIEDDFPNQSQALGAVSYWPAVNVIGTFPARGQFEGRIWIVSEGMFLEKLQEPLSFLPHDIPLNVLGVKARIPRYKGDFSKSLSQKKRAAFLCLRSPVVGGA